MLVLRLAQLNCCISFANIIKSKIFHWYTHLISQKLILILAHLVQSDIRVSALQKFSKNCIRNSIVKFAENTCIRRVVLLLNLAES